MEFILIGFVLFWIFAFVAVVVFNAISDYRTYRHIKKFDDKIKAHEDWAKVHQTKSPYEAMDECGHLAAKSKKDIDELFNKLPGL